MKKINVRALGSIVLLIALLAFTSIKGGAIRGKVTPIEGVKDVVVIIGTDTLRSQLSNGEFIFNDVKRGVYTLLIKTNPPYKDASIENVAVTDSATTDIGEIKLQQ